MWEFVETARIEQAFGLWSALVTLVKDGVPESFWLNFNHDEPTLAQADGAGLLLAQRMNEQEAEEQP